MGAMNENAGPRQGFNERPPERQPLSEEPELQVVVPDTPEIERMPPSIREVDIDDFLKKQREKDEQERGDQKKPSLDS